MAAALFPSQQNAEERMWQQSFIPASFIRRDIFFNYYGRHWNIPWEVLKKSSLVQVACLFSFWMKYDFYKYHRSAVLCLVHMVQGCVLVYVMITTVAVSIWYTLSIPSLQWQLNAVCGKHAIAGNIFSRAHFVDGTVTFCFTVFIIVLWFVLNWLIIN